MAAPRKIVSGGQTGVDRAALDVAIFLGIEHGGWCPAGRRAEDGAIPDTYSMKESPSRDYSVRTEKNVVDSDGTLILYRETITGGTELTRKLAVKHKRPYLCLDLNSSKARDHFELDHWLSENNIQVLNIAGPRESSSPGVREQAERFLVAMLKTDLE